MKRSAYAYITTGVIIILAAGLIGVLIFLKNQPPQNARHRSAGGNLSHGARLIKMGSKLPQPIRYDAIDERQQYRHGFRWIEPFSKLEKDPRLVTLFAGYPFSKDYDEEPGHVNALEDVRTTERVNETTAGTCYSCKSSNNPQLWDEMGMAEYDKMLFSELGAHISNPIGCANCHDASNMRLIVTNPALEEALVAQGKDWTTFSRQEMRTVVCANCHVEYHFQRRG